MPKLLTNNLNWKADLMTIWETTDRDDRPIVVRVKKRTIFYIDLGITAQEKYLSQQAKTDVVRRIKVRWDKNVTEKLNGIRIAEIDYNITRIYTNVETREMELSLAYVD